jgi:hypothetical protein
MRVSDANLVRKTVIRSVYSGQDRLGDIQQVDDEFVARDRRGKVIGRFNTAIEATRAIGEAVS